MPYTAPTPPSASNPEEYRYCRLCFLAQEVLIENDEPSRYVQEWTGRLEWFDPYEEDAGVAIGSFSVYVVDLMGALVDGASYFDVFDTHQSTLDVFNALYDAGTDELTDQVKRTAFGTGYPLSEGVLIINRIVIRPEHRGHAMALMMMKRLIEQFRASVGVIVLKPFPLQFEGSSLLDQPYEVPRAALRLDDFKLSERAATRKLKDYYGRLGFRAVPKTAFMVLDPGLKLPNCDELIGRLELT